MIKASLETEKETYDCIGTVSAKRGCWSFLKGGFVLDWPSNLSTIFFQVTSLLFLLLFYSVINFSA